MGNGETNKSQYIQQSLFGFKHETIYINQTGHKRAGRKNYHYDKIFHSSLPVLNVINSIGLSG